MVDKFKKLYFFVFLIMVVIHLQLFFFFIPNQAYNPKHDITKLCGVELHANAELIAAKVAHAYSTVGVVFLISLAELFFIGFLLYRQKDKT